MKSIIRIATLILLVSSAWLLLGQSGQAGTGPVAILSVSVLPSIPLNLRTTATQFLWDYDFTLPNSRACIGTVTTACVTGFTTQVTNQTTNTVIAGPTTVGLIVTVNTTGPAVGFNTPYTPPVALGQYNVQVAVNWNPYSLPSQSKEDFRDYVTTTRMYYQSPQNGAGACDGSTRYS